MIDPKHPDFSDTPVSAGRARYGYAPARLDAVLPQATVITPYHNAGEAFEQTAACVLGQSLQAFEWVIVNDASTDTDSLRRLDRYRDLDPRIRVVDHKQNKGLAGARNTGFAQARTPMVFQLDDDDLIEPTTLEKCAWFLHDHPRVGFVGGHSAGFGAQEYIWDKGFHNETDFREQNLVTATKMVRKDVHTLVGGYDESIRGGMEDYDFWMKCASHGFWGATIPEIMDWYRRRDHQHDDWSNLASEQKRGAFADELRKRYPRLYEEDGWPTLDRRSPYKRWELRTGTPVVNPLKKDGKRALIVMPWFRMGGADKFALRVGELAVEHGWGVTVAATLGGDHPWMHRFASVTSDVFALANFLSMHSFPAFLRYLIQSRGVDVVVLSNSELAHGVLPYLRATCPGVAFVDYCHMEEEYWKAGGHPRHASGMQDQLDLNIVSSEHLKRWMVERGSDPDRVDIVYTREDPGAWKPDPEARARVRQELGIDANETVLLYAGRVCGQKQPKVFADTVSELARRHETGWRAIVAGDGELERWLRDEIKSRGLDGRVLMLGAVRLEKMRELVPACDIFFLPSMQEGISLAIYEAMSCGLCVVGADVGGQKELVADGTGHLIETGGEAEDSARYADVLGELLDDRERISSIGRAARARIQDHFALDGLWGDLSASFERAITLHRDEPRVRLPVRLAEELALRAVEMTILDEEVRSLWPYYQYWVGRQDEHRDSAQRTLAMLDRSATWRLLQSMKQSGVYRYYARQRFGEGWEQADTGDQPSVVEQMERIESSRAYRVLRGVGLVPGRSTGPGQNGRNG